MTMHPPIGLFLVGVVIMISNINWEEAPVRPAQPQTVMKEIYLCMTFYFIFFILDVVQHLLEWRLDIIEFQFSLHSKGGLACIMLVVVKAYRLMELILLCFVL